MNEILIIFMILLVVLVVVSTLGGSMTNSTMATTFAYGIPSGSSRNSEIRESNEKMFQEREPMHVSIQAFDNTKSFATV
jgi:hypothetical protein